MRTQALCFTDISVVRSALEMMRGQKRKETAK